MYKTKGKRKLLLRVTCLALSLMLGMVGCEKKNNKNSRDDFGKDEFVAVMGTPQGVDTKKNSSGKKRVALTFDDGPHNVRTKDIVDELSKYGYNATFFVVGNRVDGTDYNGASALKYAAGKGNEIAIHGYTHSYYYDTCSDTTYKEELKKTESAIKSVLPKSSVRLMRPVGGKITDARVGQSKYSVIMWSIDSEDWKYKYYDNTDQTTKKEYLEIIVDNVMSNVKDGSIILMHDIYLSTYDATVVILKRLYEEGYDVVTVSELIGSDLSAGKKYSMGS